MKTLIKPVAFAALLLTGSALHAARPAAAATTAKNAIAVININAVVANSAAFKAAQAQRQTVYKAQFDAAEARRGAIIAQLQPMADKYKRDAAANPSNPALGQQQATLEQLQQSGSEELRRIMAPVTLSDQYVQEQITDKLGAAMQSAMTKNGVGMLLKAEAVQDVNSESFDLSKEVLAELDAALPAVQITPPAGWEPREVREQRAAQAAQTGARGTATGGR